MKCKLTSVKKNISAFLTLSILLFLGCSGGNAGNTNTEETTVTETKSAPSGQEQIQDISDNPAFFSAVAIEPQTAEEKEIMELIVPVFEGQLKQVKLIEEHGPYTDGLYPDVKFTLTFISRKLFDSKDCDDLHALFLQNKFNPSPRLGKKPSHGNTVVAMSFFRTTKPPTVHSLSLRMDLLNAKIIVYVYKPNSPLDRM